MVSLLAALLTLKLSTQTCLAPCTATVSVRVERHPDNRHVDLIIDGENFYTSKQIQLDGEFAPISQQPFTVKNIPAGVYEVKVTLFDKYEKQVEQRRTTLNVSGEAQQMRSTKRRTR